ncbi:hypothetical protein CURE108131_03335 [Cupriavidus respiraculi]|uniref:Uncharacterized protein n=1 Tax=Cupriavidus respiraculi TaxID=195930 RepID=A0ABM8WI32_9BURK|nr:hypothetical protein [Cupriavidus respiraculi]MBY4947980.1 hypothetical protein [Cupriavidus respiraculi]CAG9166776.1 hypothetical protein LMG21510_00539 [Cupriavidus respiraculi]
MSDDNHSIAATTLIAFAVAGLALTASILLAYYAVPPRGRNVIRNVLDRDGGREQY